MVFIVTIIVEIIMEQVSQTKRQFRIEQRTQRIAECQSSGMTVITWCKENHFSERTYYKYLKTFHLEPFSQSLFLFCGRRRESEVRPISWQEFRWLMEGLELEWKGVIKPAELDDFG